MNGILLLLGTTALFAAAYFLYGRLIERVLGVDPSRKTPAFERGDGVDYVPAHPAVLFGHHFASIAGAGPIVGPIAAAYFGWGAVVAWVVLGCIFIGAVHDMVSLWLSVRHEGRSIASVIETVLGRPGKLLFLLFCWSTLVLVCAEFTRQVALTFVRSPEVATASLLFIALAVVFGVATNRFKVPLLPATAVFVPVMFACIWVGTKCPLDLVARLGLSAAGAQTAWTLVLLAYCFLASTLPVWLLLQPRDYLNSYLLYAMMALGFLGVFAAAPAVNLDAFVGWHAPNAKGAPMPLFPFLFITIACGACSGFHSLVASGTTGSMADLKTDRIPARQCTVCIPKLNNNAYLAAVIRSSDWDLKPSSAKMYLNHNYCGEIRIAPDLTEETFLLSFGRDERFSVSRELTRSRKEEAVLKGQKREIQEYAIRVSNNQDQPRAIMVADQIPVPQEKQLTVDHISAEGASFNPENGMLSWNVTVAGKTTVETRFSYVITYPKDKTLQENHSNAGLHLKTCPQCGAFNLGNKCSVCGFTLQQP